MKDEGPLSIDAAPLRQVRLPESLCMWVEQQRYPREWKRRIGRQILVAMGIVALGFGITAGARAAGASALESLRTQGLAAPFHYERPEPVSVIFLFFAVLFVNSYWHLCSSGRSEEMRDYHLLANLSDMAAHRGLNGYLSRRWLRWSFRALASASPQAELIQVRSALRHSFLKPGLWIGGFGLILFTREMLWDELTGVRVGCWVFPRDGLSLDYVAAFGEGVELPLLGRRVVANDVAIAQIAEARTSAKSLPKDIMSFTFGRYSGEPKMRSDCSDQIRRAYPAELAASLATLMRTQP